MADESLREQLVAALSGGHAHATFDQIVDGFPADRTGTKLPGYPHSGWELLEHIRIAQHDIIEFCLSSGWVSPEWPAGYWPASPAPPHERDWAGSAEQIRADSARFSELISDPARDLHEPFPWGDGQTLLREALLILDHGSYHLGQLSLLRQALG